MRELPRGTVTFLFTDIEGSTRLLQELGDDYVDALAEHRRLLRETFEQHGGVEVDTQGDAFFVAFACAEDAVAAAAKAQQALEQGPVRVRMGIHTGEPKVTDEGYVGVDVHAGARVAAVGHGGQVLVSKATRDLLDSTVEIRDLGEHRLKDLAGPIWIFQLGRGEFPPLTSLSNTNLPVPASSFVGRERELQEARALLANSRLLTVVGPGGTGKTRFAIELAGGRLEDYPNGVFWVALAPLRDSSLVLETAAQLLGAKTDLAEHIGERRMLLLFDNFEHVVAAAPALSALLSACPNLALLVTSRELLRIAGENEYALPPLVPREAVQLFSTRARLGPSGAADELCRRLEGLPLAIELAAARAHLLSPDELLERLGERLDLLKGGRDADPRHVTLRATIAWSYDLLTKEEQRVFAALAVFPGGCTLDAAEEVCEAELETLGSLLDKSLVRRSNGRFWMLETIREYALERLDESGDAEDLRRRHSRFFLTLAREAGEGLRGADQASWLEGLEQEHDNLRAVLSRSDGDLQLEVAGALWRFWVIRGHLEEGQKWMREVLRRRSSNAALRATALHGAANLAVSREATLPMAKSYGEEALELFEALGDMSGIARAASDLAMVASIEGDNERAETLLERSRASALEGGDRQYLVIATNNLGDLALFRGDYERSLALFRESLELDGKLEFPDISAISLLNIGFASFRLRRYEEATAAIKQSLELLNELGHRPVIAQGLLLVAALAAARRRTEEAARLLAMAETLLMEIGGRVWGPAEQGLHDETAALLREQLASRQLVRAQAAGQTMALDEAVAYAVRSLD